jgi:hypothetical protein
MAGNNEERKPSLPPMFEELSRKLARLNPKGEHASLLPDGMAEEIEKLLDGWQKLALESDISKNEGS